VPRLRLKAYVDGGDSAPCCPHVCPRCPRNLCKVRPWPWLYDCNHVTPRPIFQATPFDASLFDPCQSDALRKHFPRLALRPLSDLSTNASLPLSPGSSPQPPALPAGGAPRRPLRVVYVGDGGNDACPCTTLLRPSDLALPRAGFRLAAELRARRERAGEGPSDQCVVREWATWTELARALGEL